MDNLLKTDEKIEDLCLGGLKIIQSPSLYRFTSDAVILANFISAKPSSRYLDLGSGSGIIPILVTYKNNLKSAFGIEIQASLAEMSTRSILLNNLQDKIKIINQDMLSLKSLNLGEFDVISSNPPYKKLGTSKFNQNESQKIARHETTINIRQICKVAYENLKFGGKFFVCFDADRVAELIFELKSARLEPKKMFFTQSSDSSSAKIVFVCAVKGAKECVKVLPMLITNDKDGKYLDAVKKMKF